jgi:uncharacterized membrane protein
LAPWNSALSSRRIARSRRSRRKLFFVCTCLFSLAFAMIFVVQGFWPVLPFWALEMAGARTRFACQHAAPPFYTQTVLITESQISLVTRSRRGEAKQEFARHWTKVRLRSPRKRAVSEPVDDREPGPGLRGRQLSHRGGKMPARPSVCAAWWAA